MNAGNPPAGYYADPSIPGYIRYWDGDEWVAGTSRPAPDEVAQQVADQALAGSQAGAGAPGTGQGGAHAKKAAEEQPQDSGTWQPEPAAPARTDQTGSQAGAGARSQAAEAQQPGQSLSQSQSQSQAQGRGQGQGPVQAQSNQGKQYGQASPQDGIPRQAQAQAPMQAQPQAQPQQYAQPQQAAAQVPGQQYSQAQPQQRAQPQAQPQQASAQVPGQQYPQAQPQQYAQPSAQAQFQPQQYAPTPQPQRAPQAPASFPMSAPAPAPTPAESAAFQAAEASGTGTIAVPSAFGSSHTGTFRLPGAPANPFAGLPGSPYPAAGVDVDGERSAGEATVVELATPGSRFLARIIDLGIAAVFSAPVTVSLLLVAHRHDHQYVLRLDQQATTTYTALGMDGLGIALWAGALLALVLVSIVYEGIRLGRGGQTFGKRLAGVRVVRLQDGQPLGRGDAGTRRALVFWVLAILPLVDILTLGGVLWGRPYRQGMHEKVTSTATIKA